MKWQSDPMVALKAWLKLIAPIAAASGVVFFTSRDVNRTLKVRHWHCRMRIRVGPLVLNCS